MSKTKKELYFEKLHGASNDFIFIDQAHFSQLQKYRLSSFSSEEYSFSSVLKSFVKNICERNRGIGADGVVFYKCTQDQKLKSKNFKIEILIVNSDGSYAATCGNALRCLGLKLLKDMLWDGTSEIHIHRLSPAEFQIKSEDISKEEQFIFHQDIFASLLAGEYIRSQFKQIATISVAMGKEKKVFLTPLVENSLIHFGKEIDFLTPVFVELSNPHWVFISPQFRYFNKKRFEEFGMYAQAELRSKVIGDSVSLANIGMMTLHEFPSDQINSVLEINDSSFKWNLVVYERGAGLTECCGSGATAARVALEFSQIISKGTSDVFFQMSGGLVSISNKIVSKYEQRVLSGEAKWIYRGCFSFESFSM